MIDWPTTLKALGTIAGPLLGGGGVWAYISARQARPATITASQADLVEALKDQTKMLLGESAKDRRDLKRRVDRQGTELTRLSQDVMECNNKHAECESNLAQVRSQIAQMLHSSDVAAYTKIERVVREP